MAVHSVSYIILIKFMTLLLQVKDIRRHKQDIKQKECDEGNVYPVIAGILTSGFPPCFIRSMRTGPRHQRARGHREITSSSLQVSQVLL